MKKRRTLERVEAAQARAANFAERILQDPDLADDLESLTAQEYADRRGIVITNPLERRTIKLANGNNMSKSDLQDCLDEVADILNSVYTPEASREDLAGGIGDVLDVIEGNAPEDDTDADGSDDDTDLG